MCIVYVYLCAHFVKQLGRVEWRFLYIIPFRNAWEIPSNMRCASLSIWVRASLCNNYIFRMLWTIHVNIEHCDFVISSAATHRVMRAIIVQESWFACWFTFSQMRTNKMENIVSYWKCSFMFHMWNEKCGSSCFFPFRAVPCRVVSQPTPNTLRRSFKWNNHTNQLQF